MSHDSESQFPILIGFTATDIKTSIAFYRDRLGFTLKECWPDEKNPLHASLLLDRPGGEGMAESVRMDLGDSGLFPQSLEDGAHSGAAEGLATPGQEYRTKPLAAELPQIAAQDLGSFLPKADNSLLISLALSNMHPMALEVDIVQLKIGELARPETSIEKDKDEGAVAGSLASVWVAAG